LTEQRPPKVFISYSHDTVEWPLPIGSEPTASTRDRVRSRSVRQREATIMKIYRLIAISIAILFAQPALAQKAAWGVNFQNQVFRLDGVFKQVPGSLKQVSVGADGAVWGVDPNDNVLRWTGSQWQQVQGRKLKQLSVRNAQEVWGVDASEALFRWNGSAWEQPIPANLAYVSVGADGAVCGIANGNVYCRDASTWTPMAAQGQKFRRISVTNRQRILGIDTSGNLLRWTGTGLEEVLRSGNVVDAVETADGELWTVNENGYFMWQKGTSSGSFTLVGADDQPSPSGLRQIAVVSPLAPPAGLTAEQQQMLDAHNRERQNYPGVGTLQWAPELAQWAQEWAEGRAREGNINHRQDTTKNPFRPGEYIGENIFSSGNTAATGADAVQWWIGEKEWYHHDQDDGMAGCCNQPPGCVIVRDSPACRARNGYCYCGHFTQVIWKNAQYVGCGKATAANGWVYFVCNYYPAGNYRGQKPY
jgi:tectonin-like protein/cysteine-rich secretory family protein